MLCVETVSQCGKLFIVCSLRGLGLGACLHCLGTAIIGFLHSCMNDETT